MIVFVAGSPSIDRTHEVKALTPGAIHRPTRVVAVPGGKALNAARAAHRLGADVRAIALLGGHAGRWIADALVREGVDHEVVDGPGESRMALSVAADGALTEFYEPPPPIDAEHWNALELPSRPRPRAGSRSPVRCRRARRPTPTRGSSPPPAPPAPAWRSTPAATGSSQRLHGRPTS